MRALLTATALLAMASAGALALEASDDLDEWRHAASSSRLSLAITMVRRVKANAGLSDDEATVRGYGLLKCIDATAGDGGLDSMKIADVAAACIVLSGTK